MQVFHCDHCGSLAFFENTLCVNCERLLAFVPDTLEMVSFEADHDLETPFPVHSSEPKARPTAVRCCANRSRHQVCNWTVPADDPNPLCVSCRLTTVIPDLSVAGSREAWLKIERAKRRLIYSLLQLGIPFVDKTEAPETGLSFEFLADPPEGPKVLTGHANGVITLNIAEADDVERKRRQIEMHEPFRTLVGHFRHESGHYFWDRLIRDGRHLDRFRELFGDEREDYGEALQRHYDSGPPANWQQSYISEYASTHPWEDWAETWAHYLHMVDALETASATGLSLQPKRPNTPKLSADKLPDDPTAARFGRLMQAWFPLTYVLNSLNRGLGLEDAYPFVLTEAVTRKLRFVHKVVASVTNQVETVAAGSVTAPAPSTTSSAGGSFWEWLRRATS